MVMIGTLPRYNIMKFRGLTYHEMSATINDCKVRYLEISGTLPRNVRYISYSRYMGGS